MSPARSRSAALRIAPALPRPPKMEMPRGSFGGDKWIRHWYTLDTYNWQSIGPNGNFPGTHIEELNYRPNKAARSLASHQSRLIGLIYDIASSRGARSKGAYA